MRLSNHLLAVGVLAGHDALLLLAELTLLLGLDYRAAAAAARLGDINKAGALQVVLLADILHLH